MDTENLTSEAPESSKLKRVSSPEELEELMQIAGTKSIVALFSAFAIIFIALVWSFMGAIPIKVIGNGIVLSEEALYLVTSSIQGTVVKVYVTPGQRVGEGTLLARLRNTTLALDIVIKKQSIATSESDLNLFKIRVESEDAARKNSLQKQIDAAQLAVKSAESKLPFLEKDLASKIRLQQIGILAPKDVEEARNALQQAHLDIESNTAQIATLQAQYAQAYRQDEILAKEDDIATLYDELKRLELQDTFLDIKAGSAGKIIEILVTSGDRVETGAEIASIEPPLKKGQLLQCIACFGAQYGESLDVNLRTEIEVAGIDPKEYGYLIGTTKFVSPYPVTNQEIIAEVKNAAVADYLKDDNKLVYIANISLDQDPTTVSGYRWSTEKGPPWLLDAGTTGRVLTITQEKPPILYLLPEKIAPFFFRHLEKKNP